MENINIRLYKAGDEEKIAKVVARTVQEVNIKDYPQEVITEIINTHDATVIKNRAEHSHMYVVCDNEEIVGVGAIGPYYNSETESILLTIFLLPEYEGKGIGRKIIEKLELDEYFKRADRVEIPASITGVNFYRHMGYGFKKFGNIINEKGEYRLEKFPKENLDNNDANQYHLRPYIENEYHNYYEFIYNLKKNAYMKYVEEIWGWDEELQQKYFKNFIETYKNTTYLIKLGKKTIGFYNYEILDNGDYEVGNICIIPEYQGKGIGTQILKDILEINKDKNIHIQYFKQNPVGNLYARLGFVPNGETDYHYQMIKRR